MITKQDIFEATDGGRQVITLLFPNSADSFDSRRNFRLRPDDKNPSCTVFRNRVSGNNEWLLQDKGGNDTKAYNCIELVMREQGLEFYDALKWIAQQFAPNLLTEKQAEFVKPKPTISKVDVHHANIELLKRKNGKFTDDELTMLGYKITQEVADEFFLVPIDGYINKTNEKGITTMVEANEKYPIYFYDYGTWGKIYQPLGDLRFMYYGGKQPGYWFGTRQFRKMWEAAERGKFPSIGGKDEDGEQQDDNRFENLIICSGGSDAMNVYAASTGNPETTYQVCWRNSETEPITRSDIYKLKRIAKNVFILYDADDTGMQSAYRLAFKDLDLRLIELPDDLGDYKTRKGGKCKDIKDFMTSYRPNGEAYFDPQSEFRNKLVKLAKCLKFWFPKYDKQGNYEGINISPAHLYKFLSANGFYKIPTAYDEYEFCFVKGKCVESISDSKIVSRCREFLINFIKTNTEYYDLELENMILRTKLLTIEAMNNLVTINPNFDSFDREHEYLFFRNGIVQIDENGYRMLKSSDCQFYVRKEKVIDADFRMIQEPLFKVSDSQVYSKKMSRYEELDKAGNYGDEFRQLQVELNTMAPIDHYTLTIMTDFCFVKYLYNTGNAYWRNPNGLSEKEQAETNQHFVNKATTLGYLMTKYKERSEGKMVYAMEMDQQDEGTHNGGTGKTIYMESTKYIRKYCAINGQSMKTDNDFLWQRVDSATDIVGVDDLNSKVDLNFFLPVATGDLAINRKGKDEYSIPYEKSPKMVFTSNHSIQKFSGSLRRRIIFAAFSNYYHAKNVDNGLTYEMNPKLEFGKNLFTDFNDYEWQQFFNFACACISLYKHIGVIEPPMEGIEKRIIQRELTDEFIFWADDFFVENRRLNQFVVIDDAFEEWKKTLSDQAQRGARKANFTKRIAKYCVFKGFEYNPEDLMKQRSVHEIKRNQFREYIDTQYGKEQKYCFLIRGNYE